MKIGTNREKYITIKKFTRGILSSVDIRSANKVSEEIFGKRKIMEVDNSFHLNKNQMLIGFRNHDFSEGSEVVIDLELEKRIGNGIERQSKVINILGRKGEGKTALATVIIDYLVQQRHVPIFVIDPWGEFYKRKQPFVDKDVDYEFYSRLNKHLSKYNLKIKGYKTCVISPKFLGKKPNVDKYFSISFPQVKDLINKNSYDGINLLADILGIANNEPNIDFLLRTIKSADGIHINSWSELKDTLKKLKSYSKRNDELSVRVSSIFSKLNIRLLLGVLSDDEKDEIDILQLLKENELLVFNGEIRTEEDDTYQTKIYNSILKFILSVIKTDLKNLLSNLPSTLTNKEGVWIVCDEADSVAPEKGQSSLKTDYVQLATKQRKAMISLINITQSALKLDQILFSQADYIFTFRPDEDNRKIFERRGMSEENLSIIDELKYGVETGIGIKMNECAFTTKNNSFKKFLVNVCCSGLKSNLVEN